MPDLLTFVETSVFTKRIAALGLEESLRGLQLELLDNPNAGNVEPGTAGLRKMRLGDPSRSKWNRGGARVHYLRLPHRARIYLMFVYGQNEASTFTADPQQTLRALVAHNTATEAPKT